MKPAASLLQFILIFNYGKITKYVQSNKITHSDIPSIYFQVIFVLTASRGGGGSRSSGSRTSSGSSYRYSSGVRTISSRFTSGSGFNSANRFSYTPTSGIYRYGAYSGTRFGTSIGSIYIHFFLFIYLLLLNKADAT